MRERLKEMSTYPIFRTKNEAQCAPQNVQREKRHSLYLVYASQFTEYRTTIEAAKDTFSQEQIWPDQCDYILYKIRPLQKTANRIAAITDSTKKQGSKNLGYNHYPLLVSAHYFCDQIEMLAAFIREYKETTENRSAKKSKHRLIVSSLHNLESSLHDLMKELDKTMKNS
jgi:hypothetical protein